MMPYYEILILATALSMDAFAVALGTGLQLCSLTSRQYFRLAFHFGLFQFMMPVLGWGLGLTVRGRIEAWDHWAAFLLLLLIGAKMIYDSLKKDQTDAPKKDPTQGVTLILLSIATSIDALAVGLSLSLIGRDIWIPALCIGLMCGLLTVAGLKAGCLISRATALGSKASFAGGLVLIVLGINILWEHGALPFF